MSVVRTGTDADLEGLAAIHVQCFPDPWDVRALRDLLAIPGTFLFCALDGFILGRAAGGEAEILTLAVAPQSRRQGAGLALVRAACDHASAQSAQAMFLEVAAGNRAARSLYGRLGFVESGVRKGYYTAGRAVPEDALVLRKSLPLSPL